MKGSARYLAGGILAVVGGLVIFGALTGRLAAMLAAVFAPSQLTDGTGFHNPSTDLILRNQRRTQAGKAPITKLPRRFRGAPASSSGYSSPVSKSLTRGRTDEGVDFSGKGGVFAVGPGVIKSVRNSGWPGGTYILLQLDSGRSVYYAEDITPAVRVGQRVTSGQLLGRATGGSSGIEVGWGTKTPGVALAHGHYSEGQVTAEGRNFLKTVIR